ncbi:hypothetical protein XENORESO_019681 [Xenotaenia resolanae]|uniref:Uncharacterized protein n=1 Tax=Xenotaenia resolanae TaxID=208358 RepID=A0ABV0VMP7_9TELE
MLFRLTEACHHSAKLSKTITVTDFRFQFGAASAFRVLYSEWEDEKQPTSVWIPAGDLLSVWVSENRISIWKYKFPSLDLKLRITSPTASLKSNMAADLRK